MGKGLLIIFSGPSGVGKGTVREHFMKDESLNLVYSISMTTRLKRAVEKEGIDYFFVDVETFEQAIINDELLEYAIFVGNYYGSPKANIDKLRNEGKNVILEIEVEGAKQVLEKCPDALSIFLVPPSLQELENRIRGRKSESEEMIKKRMLKAERELEEVKDYKYIVCNQSPKEAATTIQTIIKRHAILAGTAK